MKYTTFPNTDIKVSKICLGTMTFGEQNTEKEAHEQLSFAVDSGINFIDTAELYAIPIKPKTQGLTEKYIGTWLKSQKREDLVIASKAAGPMPKLTHIRNVPNFSKEHIREAVEGSLSRLQTDYIDLYQLHWPERVTNYFGALGYIHHSDDVVTNIKETLLTLKELVDEGKIRHIGISNETPWGVMQFLKNAEEFNLPRVISIQNPYSLVNRVFEIGLAEFSMREQVPLLAYSPLGGGLLSGKYVNNHNPQGARYEQFPNYFSRYSHPNTTKAIEEYNTLSKEAGIPLAQLSLAYVNTREFLLSNIIGATKLNQLKENINSIHVTLTDDVLKEIERIHLLYPNPAP
jgi:aryl-alcohol dehydrogenase-like predicted oxidoreductase